MLHYYGTYRTIFLAALLLLCSAAQLLAADVSLAWNASVSQNISGYKVYVGTAAGSYGTPTTIGNQTTHTATVLSAGTYYFAVKAVNTSGYESDYSNVVSTTIAGSSVTCDLNGDGSINAGDLQKMVNIILGNASFSSSYDLNSDGSVNVLDFQILTDVVLGLRSCS